MKTSSLKTKGTHTSRLEFVAGLRILGLSSVYWFPERLHDDGRLVIGRTRQRDIRIKCRSVSRRHCEVIQVGPGSFLLRDLGSRNGIKVAVRGHYGRWVARHEVMLEPGIHIKLGRAVIVPVDPQGECPINARNFQEFARAAKATYGSARAAEKHVGRSRKWIDSALRALLKEKS